MGGDPEAPEFTVDTVRVLFVDDDPQHAAAVAEFFGSVDDVSAVVETSAREGLARLHDEEIDVVVSDDGMPETDGLEFLKRLREDHPDLPFVLLTGQESEAVVSEAISAGVTDYVRKGSGTAQYRELGDQLRRAAVGYRARRRLRVQEARFRKLIEGSTDLVPVLDDGRGFFVEDDGPGVPLDAREQAFDRGYTTSREGTGFGLSIVRSIVEAHGWDVVVTAGDDGGARFEVTGVELA